TESGASSRARRRPAAMIATMKAKKRKAPGADGSAAGADPSAGARQSILRFLKREKHAGIAEIAAHLHVSYEGARQHMARLEADKLVEKRIARPARAAAGRPLARYTLSRAGDHLFPKRYDELTIEL